MFYKEGLLYLFEVYLKILSVTQTVVRESHAAYEEKVNPFFGHELIFFIAMWRAHT
jgi:hypothetical protein